MRSAQSHHHHHTSFPNLGQRKLHAMMQKWFSPILIHFLFSEPSNVFHSDFPPHAPAGSILFQSKFAPTPVYNYNNLPYSKISTPSSPSQHSFDAFLNFLYAPAASVNNVLLGYALGEALTNDIMSPHAPYRRTGRYIRGRFLFDGCHLIMVYYDFVPNCISIFTRTWTNDNYPTRMFFTVPAAQYSFLNLPQHVISTLTITERPSPAVALPHCQNPSLSYDIHSFIRRLPGCFTDRSATHEVFNIHSGELATRSSGFLHGEVVMATSQTPLKLHFFTVYSNQRGIERVLNRASYAGVYNIRGPPLCSCAQCYLEDRAIIGTLTNDHTLPGTQRVARRRVARRPANFAEEIMDEMLSIPCILANQQQPVTQASRITRVHTPSVRVLQRNSQSGTMQLERLREQSIRIAQQLKEQKLETRRRRNRVSAAKSNLKKKLQVEQQERDLEVLKKRKVELLATQERLQQENETLKRHVFGRLRS